MKVIGIVGGIGAGKSTIVALMNEIKPMTIISADLIGHEILLKGESAYEQIIQDFGKDILDDSGEIIRSKLGQIVFGDEGRLNRLNAITHPIILERIKARIAHAKKVAPSKHIILEAALLLESGLVDLTDVVIAVYADRNLRVNRVMVREGVEHDHVLKRMAAQKEWEEMKEAASYIIDNSFSLETTKEQIRQLLGKL